MEMIHKTDTLKIKFIIKYKFYSIFFKKTIFKCDISSKILKTNISKRIFSDYKKKYSVKLI